METVTPEMSTKPRPTPAPITLYVKSPDGHVKHAVPCSGLFVIASDTPAVPPMPSCVPPLYALAADEFEFELEQPRTRTRLSLRAPTARLREEWTTALAFAARATVHTQGMTDAPASTHDASRYLRYRCSTTTVVQESTAFSLVTAPTPELPPLRRPKHHVVLSQCHARLLSRTAMAVEMTRRITTATETTTFSVRPRRDVYEETDDLQDSVDSQWTGRSGKSVEIVGAEELWQRTASSSDYTWSATGERTSVLDEIARKYCLGVSPPPENVCVRCRAALIPRPTREQAAFENTKEHEF